MGIYEPSKDYWSSLMPQDPEVFIKNTIIGTSQADCTVLIFAAGLTFKMVSQRISTPTCMLHIGCETNCFKKLDSNKKPYSQEALKKSLSKLRELVLTQFCASFWLEL